MKILQLFDFFSIAHGGGSVDNLYRLSQALAHKGHKITIYTSDFNLDQEFIDSLQGVRVYPFHSWLNILRMPLVPSLVTEVKKTLKEFDIVHLHQYRSFQNIVIHHYARQYDIPYVLQAHGSLTTFFQKGLLKKTFDTIWGYNILRDASKLIAVTEKESEQYKSMGINHDKIEVVPNGIDPAEFENLPPRGEFRKKWSMNDSQKIILYLARINKIKGPDLLVKAFANLTREQNDVRLVMAGPDDGYLTTLRKLVKELGIKDKTIFTGPLYGRDKLEAYIDANVYVLPSTYEIFGITVLEACLCGAPVIVTERCGIAPEITGDLGQVIKYDENELKNAMVKALAAPEPAGEFKEKQRQALQARFSWDKLAAEVENIYQGIVDRVEGKG